MKEIKQIRDKFHSQVWGGVYDQIRIRVSDQVWNRAWDECLLEANILIGDGVYAPVRNSLINGR